MTAGPAPARLRIVTLTLAIVLLVIDQATKWWATSNLEVGVRHDVLGEFLGVTLVFNPGAAFSLGTSVTWVFTIAMVLVIVIVAVLSRRIGSLAWALALGSLVGGAMGNLVDRLARDPGFGVGHVVDFIAYADWFVGNVADIAIVGAAIGIAALSFTGRRLDGTREGEDGRHD